MLSLATLFLFLRSFRRSLDRGDSPAVPLRDPGRDVFSDVAQYFVASRSDARHWIAGRQQRGSERGD